MGSTRHETNEAEDTHDLTMAEESSESQLKRLRRYRALISKEKQLIRSMDLSRDRSFTTLNDKGTSKSGKLVKRAMSVEDLDQLKGEDNFVNKLMDLPVNDFRKACSMLDLQTIQDAAKKTNPLRHNTTLSEQRKSQETPGFRGHQRKFSYDPPKSHFKFKYVELEIDKSDKKPLSTRYSVGNDPSLSSVFSPLNSAECNERRKKFSAVKPLWKSCDNLDSLQRGIECSEIDIDGNENLKPNIPESKFRRSSSPALQKRMEEAHQKSLRRMKALKGLESDCLKAKSMIETYRSNESLNSSTDSPNTTTEHPNDSSLRFTRARVNRLERGTKCWSWNVGETRETIV